jgi:hypothetical protein
LVFLYPAVKARFRLPGYKKITKAQLCSFSVGMPLAVDQRS